MFVDALNQLSDAQALTATAFSTNTFDSGDANNDISIGEPLGLAIGVDVAADFTTTDETYEIQIVQSANANLSSPDVLASRPILASDLTAGKLAYLGLPAGSKTKRYLGARYILGGTTPSITLTTFLQPLSMIEAIKNYPSGFQVL